MGLYAMKWIAIVVLLSTLNARGFSRDEFAEGYIIPKNADTLACKVKIPKDFGHFNELYLFNSVTVMDSSGRKITFGPKDLEGYGFVYQSRKYTYVSKRVDEDGTLMFVWPVNLGKRVNEYYYYNFNSSDLRKGSWGGRADVYVLEDAAKETISITRGGSLANTYKQQLRNFFENDKQLLELIAIEVNDFYDISRFVKAANRL